MMLRLAATALAATAIAAALAACGGSGRVSLARLAGEQQRFAGSVVTTSGTVREQRDPDGTRYFVLADEAGDLVGLEPRPRARSFRDAQVVVTGAFSVEPGFGRVIRISSIERGA